MIRHVVDGATPPFTFLLLHNPWGARWAAVTALLAAVLIGALRRRRGEPLGVVAASTAFVALHSAGAIVMGEGRAFFLPEVIVNATMLVVCLGSLLLDRPITALACRKIGLESEATRRAPGTPWRHRRLTAAWTVMWFVHLVPLTYLYAIDSVAGLTVLGTAFNKPTLLAMAALTVIAQRRATVRADLTAPSATPG